MKYAAFISQQSSSYSEYTSTSDIYEQQKNLEKDLKSFFSQSSSSSPNISTNKSFEDNSGGYVPSSSSSINPSFSTRKHPYPSTDNYYNGYSEYLNDLAKNNKPSRRSEKKDDSDNVDNKDSVIKEWMKQLEKIKQRELEKSKETELRSNSASTQKVI
jgi:hypothetical protein